MSAIDGSEMSIIYNGKKTTADILLLVYTNENLATENISFSRIQKHYKLRHEAESMLAMRRSRKRY